MACHTLFKPWAMNQYCCKAQGMEMGHFLNFMNYKV